MRIKNESIQEVLTIADIVSVVEDYIKLKQSGRNFVGLCPFHKEKTPSFTVSREKGLFHCFGCGTGGNVVSFLMKYEKLSFVEAIEELAKKFGVKLEYESGFYREEDQELEQLYEYSQKIFMYFHNNLINTNEGKLALTYLKERGIGEDTIKTFQLGYALSAWDGLVAYAKKNNFNLDILEKLGLIIKKEGGDYYDRFRGRIIFPIISTTGRIIAFGGRILKDEPEQPKYLNSPESKIYIKGKTLYGLFQTKDFIRKNQNAILVEGYMDFLSLYQNDIKNVVASAGTALTIDQIYLLTKISPLINLVFDGDQAGQKAAIRAIDLLIQTDVDFRIVVLPEDEDPDSYIRKNGRESFNKLISEGKNYIDFYYDIAAKNSELSNPNNKIKAINSLLEITAKVSNPLKREILAREIAKKFNVTENSILQQLNKFIKSYLKTEERQVEYQRNIGEQSNIQKTIHEISPIEKSIIKLICEVEHQYLEPIFSNIEDEDFTVGSTREIFKVLRDEYLNLSGDDKIDTRVIANKLYSDELRSIFADAIIEKYKISEGWNEVDEITKKEIDYTRIITDYIKKLKDISLSKKIEELTMRLKNTNDFDQTKKILSEIDELVKKRTHYQSNFQIT